MSEPSNSRALSPVAQVCSTIKRPEFRQQLASALPPGVDVDRFTRVVLTAIQQNPKIASGDKQSLYNSAVRAAADGLLPDGREGAFVEFGNKVQWMPMVGGVIKRLAQANITIDAQVVYENDEFEQVLGDDAAIHHKAPKLGQSRGNPIGVYAIARLPNGMIMREVMDYDAVEQVRNASRSKNAGPWKDWWTEMARKTVIRRLAKRLPILDSRVAETLAADDDLYDFANGNAGEGDTPTQQDEPAPAPAGKRRPRGLDAVAAAADESAPENDATDPNVIDGEATPAADPAPTTSPDTEEEPDF